MEIITSELGGRTWPEPEFSIVKRCIHTSADFDYADNLCFSENAANIGVEALKKGAHIVTDTRMAWSGINKKKLESLGGQAHCFMQDEDVAQLMCGSRKQNRRQEHCTLPVIEAQRREHRGKTQCQTPPHVSSPHSFYI